MFGVWRAAREEQATAARAPFFNKRNHFEPGDFRSVSMKLGGGGVKINHLSLFVSALCHGGNDSHLVFFFSLCSLQGNWKSSREPRRPR